MENEIKKRELWAWLSAEEMDSLIRSQLRNCDCVEEREPRGEKCPLCQKLEALLRGEWVALPEPPKDRFTHGTARTLFDAAGNSLIHILEDTLHLTPQQGAAIMAVCGACEDSEDAIEYRFTV